MTGPTRDVAAEARRVDRLADAIARAIGRPAPWAPWLTDGARSHELRAEARRHLERSSRP